MPLCARQPVRFPVNSPAIIRLTRRPIAGPKRVAGESHFYGLSWAGLSAPALGRTRPAFRETISGRVRDRTDKTHGWVVWLIPGGPPARGAVTVVRLAGPLA